MSAPAELAAFAIEEVWGPSRADLLEDVYAPGCVDHQPMPGQAAGVPGFRQVMRVFTTAFADLSMTLHGVAAEGDLACDWWTLRARHVGELLGVPPTGREVVVRGADVVRVRAGRVVEVWHAEGVAQALGLAPPPLVLPGRATWSAPAPQPPPHRTRPAPGVPPGGPL